MQPEHLIRSVLPVILLIIFGFWLQKRHYFSEETVQGVTKLVSDYLIPCTIFTTFIGLDLRPEHFGLAACTFLIQLRSPLSLCLCLRLHGHSSFLHCVRPGKYGVSHQHGSGA